MAQDDTERPLPGGFDPPAGPPILQVTPTTGPQREMWLATRLGPEASLAFNESMSLRLLGHLDVAALQLSLQAVVARHEALRSALTSDGLALSVADSVPVEISVIDEVTADASARDAIWERLLMRAVEEPFDLERGPLLRAVILRCGPEEHRVVLTTHHIVCDGRSTLVLVHEWAKLYSEAVTGKPSALPPPESFTEYARAQADRAGSTEQVGAESYWVRQFSDDVPILDLPVDHARPALKTYRSRREDSTLDGPLVSRLRVLAGQQGTDLLAVLLAGFQVLLYRLTSQEDLVVGIPAAAQAVESHERLVGHCVHLLPLRSRLQGNQPFRGVLGDLRMRLSEALNHRQWSLGSLLEHLAFHRDPGRSPLVSVVFNLTRGLIGDELHFYGVAAEASTNPRRFENFDLVLNAVERNGHVSLECQYSADLFDTPTIQRWLEMYRRLLVSIVEDPERQVALLALMPDDDVQRLARWNDTTAEFPNVCIHQLIEDQARRTPDAPALRFEGRTITYAELNGRSNQIARHLRGCGVARGTLVGLCVERSPEMVAGLLGILKAGGGYVPLDPGYPPDRLAFMLSDSRMPVLLTEVGLQRDLPAGRVVCLDDIGEADTRDLPVDESSADPGSIAYVIYTSGSTGKPKGVLVPHRSVVNLLASVARRPGMRASDVVLAITTLSFDIAVSEILLPLSVGAQIVLAGRDVAADGFQLLNLIEETGVTFIDATPSTWKLLIDAGWDGNSRLTAICTGEAMPRDLALELIGKAESVWNGYGPTEATVWSTFAEIRHPVERILIGTPVANTRIHILDERMQAVPIGVSGELYIGGAGVTDGYLNRPDLTNERFVRDPFEPAAGARIYRTGDIARYRSTGEIECLGRNDHQVKIRGFRIELGEIEEALAGHEAVRRVAVMARDDRPGDRRLVAYIVVRDGGSATDAELKTHLARTLPSHMIPAAFIRLEAMPLTPSGKIDRRNLPTAADGQAPEATHFVAPRTATEAMVAELWRQALGVARVSVNDDFFVLGGHSLLASQVLARLRRDHGVVIKFRKLFEAPTVSQLAELIDTTPSATHSGPAITHLTHEGPAPLSVGQERVWLLEMMEPRQRVLHNLPSAWTLSGRLDEEAFERCLTEIIARHATLRTRIVVRDGIPFQEEAPLSTAALTRLDLRDQPRSERDAAMFAYFDRAIETPYDLSIAPLFRATLVRLDESTHVLFILPHSLIWDGWSFDIFQRELSALYTAFSSGAPSPFGALPISYVDFIRWQRDWLNSVESAEQRAWWRAQLGGDLPVLELPTDHARPEEQTWAGMHIDTRLPADEAEGLKSIARESGATLFTVLFAAFAVLLHRVTGQDDLIVGTPVRARTRPELEELIAPFMNMLVLRSRMEPDMTFVEFLARVRDMTLDSFSHQELPLEVVDVRAPILRAFFVYQDSRERPETLGGLQMDHLRVLPSTSDGDLRLELTETREGLSATLTGSSELFDVATLHRFLGRFRTLVSGVVRNPHGRVSELELIHEKERALLEALSGPELPPGTASPVCVHTLFEERARETPHAVALVAGEHIVDYGELDRRANEVAGELRARGIGGGSRVGVHLNRSPELVTALLGVMKAGATWVTFDPADPESRIAAILEDSGAALVLTQEHLRRQLPAVSPPIVCLDPQAPAGDGALTTFPSVPIDSTAVLLYGSDADGRLRGSSLSHRGLSSVTTALTDELKLGERDNVLAISPPSLDVSVIELLAPLAAGARVTIDAGDDPESVAEAVTTAAVTLMIAPTAVWREMLAARAHSWPLLRAVAVGDLPDRETTVNLISSTASAWMAQGFREAGIWSTLQRLDGSEPPGLLGRRLPDAQVRILDRDLRDVPIGVIGELCVGTAGCPVGYSGTPGLDDDRFVPPIQGRHGRLYRTGERARWRSEGVLQRLSRRRGEVDVKGFRTSLDEISSILRRHPAIDDAAAVLQTQRGGRPRLVAYIVPRSGSAYTDTDLRRELKRVLPARMLPRAFLEVDALARTCDGAFHLEGLGVDDREDEYVAPRSEIEVLLAGLWGDALGVQRVGVHDNFFSLGGYSLLCFQVMERIEHATGQRINPRFLLLDSLQQVASRLEKDARDNQGKAVGNGERRILHRIGKLLGGLASGTAGEP